MSDNPFSEISTRGLLEALNTTTANCIDIPEQRSLHMETLRLLLDEVADRLLAHEETKASTNEAREKLAEKMRSGLFAASRGHVAPTREIAEAVEALVDAILEQRACSCDKARRP